VSRLVTAWMDEREAVALAARVRGHGMVMRVMREVVD
jgi:hypothetical protein